MAQNGLLDFLQGASNSVASNVSAPVDGLAWLMRKAGMDVNTPVGGSDWMRQRGLTAEPQNKLLGLLGESVGGVAPMLAAAKAPQIAGGFLQMGKNAMSPQLLNKQAGALKIGDYGASHRPMNVKDGASMLHDLSPTFGDDIYTKNALQYFGSGDKRELPSVKVMQAMKNNPDGLVTIYRGVPSATGAKINAGDWVTLNPEVAADYGAVIKSIVPASHVTSWPDSLLEFGYHPPK